MISTYLYKMFPNEEKRRNFLIQSILTFNLRIESVCKLLGISSDEIYDFLFKTGNSDYNSLNFVLKNGVRSQTQAINEFKEFFESLVDAVKKKDKEKIKNIMSILSDKKAKDIIKNKKRTPWKEEEILVLLKYQIKYSLSQTDIEKIFRIDNYNYSVYVRKLQDKYPELVSYFDYLTDMYYNKYRKHWKR